MRRDLLAVTAVGSATFLAGWSGSALAAPPVAYNWSGAYLGGSAGFNDPAGATTFAYPTGGPDDIEFNSSGAPFLNSLDPYNALPTSVVPYAPLIGTVSAGFNHQTGALVLGIETDASLLGDSKYNFTGNGGDETFTTSGGMQSLFTLRPRLGIAVDKLLLYGTGGLAFGEAKFDTGLHLTDDGKGISTADWSGSNSAWKTGFTIGGGAEYAVNNRLSLKFEALYYNLGSIDVTATGSGFTSDTTPAPLSATPYTGHMDLQGTIARVGLTFHLQ